MKYGHFHVCEISSCPFLRRIHQTGESWERCEGKTWDDSYAMGLESNQSIHDTKEDDSQEKKKATTKCVKDIFCLGRN